VASQRRSGNLTKAQGLVAYYMIPIPVGSVVWPAPRLYHDDYKSGEISVPDLFTNVFMQGRRFEILASVAFAIQARYNRDYNGAHSAFCHAKVTLERELHKGTWTDPAIDAGKLANGIDALLNENDSAARNSRDYVGGLSLYDVRSPGCPHA
jgi:hypothetical protein